MGSSAVRLLSLYAIASTDSQRTETAHGAQWFSGSLPETKDVFKWCYTEYVTVCCSGGCCSTHEITVLFEQWGEHKKDWEIGWRPFSRSSSCR